VRPPCKRETWGASPQSGSNLGEWSRRGPARGC